MVLHSPSYPSSLILLNMRFLYPFITSPDSTVVFSDLEKSGEGTWQGCKIAFYF